MILRPVVESWISGFFVFVQVAISTDRLSKTDFKKLISRASLTFEPDPKILEIQKTLDKQNAIIAALTDKLQSGDSKGGKIVINDSDNEGSSNTNDENVDHKAISENEAIADARDVIEQMKEVQAKDDEVEREGDDNDDVNERSSPLEGQDLIDLQALPLGRSKVDSMRLTLGRPDKSDIGNVDFEPFSEESWEDKIYDYDQHDCSTYMAEPGTYEPIPLLSFPGSGNTWSRFLIEKATGVYSGSVYHDGGLYRHGHYLGEMEHPLNGTTIVQKVHRVRSNAYSIQLFKKARYCIFLMRDPRKAFMSEYNRLNSHSHMGTVDHSTFQGKEWEDKAGIWATVGFPDAYAFPKRISCQTETLYLFYEDLRKVDLDEDEIQEKFFQKLGKFFQKKQSSTSISLSIRIPRISPKPNEKSRHVHQQSQPRQTRHPFSKTLPQRQHLRHVSQKNAYWNWHGRSF